MRTEVIQADSIDAAAEQLLDELKERSNGGTRRIAGGGREHVIYFNGWGGLGASAVLRAVAQRLVPGAPEAQGGLHFDQIIHIDCSKWESRRSLQRALVEQLSLPAGVIKMIDKQDEEDDFNGVAQGSRAEIPQVLEAMNQRIQKLNHRFLVIFHNGSSEEIDLSIFGFPLFGYWANKVLWTFQGRFRLKPREKIDNAMKSTGKTDVFLSASRHEKDEQELWSVLVHQEAAEVASMISTGSSIIQPSQVAECFLYMSKLCCLGYQLNMDYNMATHSCNYWVCDAIIQQGDGGFIGTEDDHASWQAAEALQLAMPFDVDNYNNERPYLLGLLHHLVICDDSRTSAPYWHLQIPSIAIPNAVMFQKFDKLSVLKLSGRIFSLSSPPFLHYHSLKFLWLDHCQDQEINTDGSGTNKEEDIQRCFQRLWVLDVRYMRCDRILSAWMLDFMSQLRELNVKGTQDWDIGQLQGRLPNIRKLRVTQSTVSCSSCPENNLILGMSKMELLEFSGNCTTMPVVANISEMSTFSDYLETVIITDGCVGIQKFSFKGCTKLKHLLLSGLFEDLCILDLSGTAVKTLELSAMTARNLDELFLDDCEKLCAILWPPEDKRKSYLQKLQIDSTQSAAASSLAHGRDEKSMVVGNTTTSVRRRLSASLSVTHGGRLPSEFYWCIWVRDARLLRSLVPFGRYFDKKFVHMEISSPDVALGSASKDDDEAADSRSSVKQGKDNLTYTDVVDSLKACMLLQPARQGDGDTPTVTGICSCPHMLSLDANNCYMHMQDCGQRRTESLQEGEETSAITIPDMICRNAQILHVHDSLSITSIPGPAPMLSSTWLYLRWCRVERCPKLECVFTTPQLKGSGDNIFYYLTTLWASQLPKARYIWNWSTALSFDLGEGSFEEFRLLHLDLCPRIIHVLPLAMPMVEQSLRNLVTLEIMWSGDLEVVFSLYTNADESSQHQEQSIITVEFQKLKHIHLHELPKLQGICGRWMISAPMLETVKIRGCWSLKRLPAISSDMIEKVECDCEREWWEKLEWDMDANHQPSMYKPTHSRYYKKTMLRSSVLI